MPPAPLRFVQADLENPDHQAAVLFLADAYSRDAMGDGTPLAPAVRERLIAPASDDFGLSCLRR